MKLVNLKYDDNIIMLLKLCLILQSLVSKLNCMLLCCLLSIDMKNTGFVSASLVNLHGLYMILDYMRARMCDVQNIILRYCYLESKTASNIY